MNPWLRRSIALVVALVASRLVAPWWCGRHAEGWYQGDPDLQRALAEEMVAFEEEDDRSASKTAPGNRFAGEWALVTHQMTAIGLAQLCLARSAWCPRYAPVATRAAAKTLLPEMRDFGTRAWRGEDALASLASDHGHAYLAYSTLAVGMARLVDPELPAALAAQHDALVAAYERRLLAAPMGLIETYPGEAYPTDVAAVAAAIAVHGRATGRDHQAVLAHWAERVRAVQIDRASGLVIQRMGSLDGQPHDAPRGSGTALAAYFAGFADRKLAAELARGLFRHEATFWGFGAIQEYAPGHQGAGDVDSGPVLLGVSVSATGFALAPARAFGMEEPFERLYRTAALFGVPIRKTSRLRFATGGAIGNALLLALMTSGPELAP
ncbi:MAG: hypothetical protein JRI23_02070 [Deltaproteobacteria bacterium]|nr:hypothetical protein [Deltaproteobacteria bacterium]MBW2530265.1 hypothetical protein [Deltaproteobacteria bacterium]